MNKKDYYWAKYMLIFGFFCISFGTSIFLKTEHAPDEAMRMLIPEYIVSHHTLPAWKNRCAIRCGDSPMRCIRI